MVDVEGVQEGHLAIDSERQEEGVDLGFEVMPVEVVEGVGRRRAILPCILREQGEGVEGAEEGHLATGSEK